MAQHLTQEIRVERPQFSLTLLSESVVHPYDKFVSALARAEIPDRNYGMTRSVFCADFDEDQETSAFADTDICCSFLANLAENPDLLTGYFGNRDQRIILDRNVLLGDSGEYHIGCEFKGGVFVVRRIPKIEPEDISNYRFIKVALVGS